MTNLNNVLTESEKREIERRREIFQRKDYLMLDEQTRKRLRKRQPKKRSQHKQLTIPVS